MYQCPPVVARDVVVDEDAEGVPVRLALGEKPLQLLRLAGVRRGVEYVGQPLGAVSKISRHGSLLAHSRTRPGSVVFVRLDMPRLCVSTMLVDEARLGGSHGAGLREGGACALINVYSCGV